MLSRVALVRTEVSEELGSSIIRVTRIGELGTLAVTSNRSVFLRSVSGLVVTANVPISPNLVAVTMMEGLSSYETQFIQEQHSVISQKMAFFTVSAVKTSNLT
jgi:hypothetical protein